MAEPQGARGRSLRVRDAQAGEAEQVAVGSDGVRSSTDIARDSHRSYPARTDVATGRNIERRSRVK
jgi:hypothetical protein